MSDLRAERKVSGVAQFEAACFGSGAAAQRHAVIEEKIAAVTDTQARAALYAFRAAQCDTQAKIEAARELDQYLPLAGVREAAEAIVIYNDLI